MPRMFADITVQIKVINFKQLSTIYGSVYIWKLNTQLMRTKCSLRTHGYYYDPLHSVISRSLNIIKLN